MAKVKRLTREEGTAKSYTALNRCLMATGRGIETETEEQFLKRSQDLYGVLLPLHIKAVEAGEYDAMHTVYRLFFQAPDVMVSKRPTKWKTDNRRRLDKVNAITKQVLPALRNLEVLTAEKHGGDKKELARLNKELKAVEKIIPTLERYVEINRSVLADADYETDRITFLKGQKHWMDHTRLKEAIKTLETIRSDDPYATISRLLKVAPRPPHKIPNRKTLYQRLNRKA